MRGPPLHRGPGNLSKVAAKAPLTQPNSTLVEKGCGEGGVAADQTLSERPTWGAEPRAQDSLQFRCP